LRFGFVFAELTYMRHLKFDPPIRIPVLGSNRSIIHARHFLADVGITVLDEVPRDADAVIIAGEDSVELEHATHGAQVLVRLWDFQVHRRGSGAQASAVSGVSCVLGFKDRAPLVIPAEIPEKWCALMGASIALSVGLGADAGWAGSSGSGPHHVDISTAEILRSFADQNFANHKAYPESWSRNGRVTPSHGGIYPQGFFQCKDGYVAVVGRSKADWQMILSALGDPSWAQGSLLDPVHLAQHPEEVDELFLAELARFERDELLEAAIRTGATFAPVYSPDESRAKGLVPADLFQNGQHPNLPFVFTPFESHVPLTRVLASDMAYSGR